MSNVVDIVRCDLFGELFLPLSGFGRSRAMHLVLTSKALLARKKPRQPASPRTHFSSRCSFQLRICSFRSENRLLLLSIFGYSIPKCHNSSNNPLTLLTAHPPRKIYSSTLLRIHQILSRVTQHLRKLRTDMEHRVEAQLMEPLGASILDLARHKESVEGWASRED